MVYSSQRPSGSGGPQGLEAGPRGLEAGPQGLEAGLNPDSNMAVRRLTADRKRAFLNIPGGLVAPGLVAPGRQPALPVRGRALYLSFLVSSVASGFRRSRRWRRKTDKETQ